MADAAPLKGEYSCEVETHPQYYYLEEGTSGGATSPSLCRSSRLIGNGPSSGSSPEGSSISVYLLIER